jgi:hypothetical protein
MFSIVLAAIQCAGFQVCNKGLDLQEVLISTRCVMSQRLVLLNLSIRGFVVSEYSLSSGTGKTSMPSQSAPDLFPCKGDSFFGCQRCKVVDEVGQDDRKAQCLLSRAD